MLGATAYKKFDVPADWADAEDETETTKLTGRESVVKQVKDIMIPVGRMDGDSLPVSAFVHSCGRPVRAGRCRL